MKAQRYLDLSEVQGHYKNLGKNVEFLDDTVKQVLKEGKADKALRWKIGGGTAAAVFTLATIGWGLLGPKAAPTRTADNL